MYKQQLYWEPDQELKHEQLHDRNAWAVHVRKAICKYAEQAHAKERADSRPNQVVPPFYRAPRSFAAP